MKEDEGRWKEKRETTKRYTLYRTCWRFIGLEQKLTTYRWTGPSEGVALVFVWFFVVVVDVQAPWDVWIAWCFSSCCCTLSSLLVVEPVETLFFFVFVEWLLTSSFLLNGMFKGRPRLQLRFIVSFLWSDIYVLQEYQKNVHTCAE